jgi:hypothetical protein
LDKTEHKVKGRIKLPGKVIPHGLAVAGGRIFLVTQDGAVVCLGT